MNLKRFTIGIFYNWTLYCTILMGGCMQLRINYGQIHAIVYAIMNANLDILNEVYGSEYAHYELNGGY